MKKRLALILTAAMVLSITVMPVNAVDYDTKNSDAGVNFRVDGPTLPPVTTPTDPTATAPTDPGTDPTDPTGTDPTDPSNPPTTPTKPTDPSDYEWPGVASTNGLHFGNRVVPSQTITYKSEAITRTELDKGETLKGQTYYADTDVIHNWDYAPRAAGIIVKNDDPTAKWQLRLSIAGFYADGVYANKTMENFAMKLDTANLVGAGGSPVRQATAEAGWFMRGPTDLNFATNAALITAITPIPTVKNGIALAAAADNGTTSNFGPEDTVITAGGTSAFSVGEFGTSLVGDLQVVGNSVKTYGAAEPKAIMKWNLVSAP